MSRGPVELLAADREARRLARTLFDRPFVLEAGAGTGKTAVLVARAVSWILGPGWECETAERGEQESSDLVLARRVLDGLLAITFTEAAAAEMAQRLGHALDDVVAGRPPLGCEDEVLPSSWPGRAVAALAVFDHLRVQTIHSFCRSLLVAYPLEASVHPRFEVDADGEATAQIVRDVLDERLRVGLRDGDAALLTLASHGYGPWEIGEALEQFRSGGGRACDLEADPLAPPRVAALLDRVRSTCGDLAAELADLAGASSRLKKAREIAAELAAVADLALVPEPVGAKLAGLRDRAAATLAAVDTKLADWRRGKFTDTESAAFGSRARAISKRAAEARELLHHLERLDANLLGAARSVLARLLDEIESRRRVEGVASFDDLLHLAVALLRRHEPIRRRLRRGLRQILVDEFQDTDPLQCELLSWIALEGPVEARPGLFLVGDPKQSIYGWRRADLGAYDRFLAALNASIPPAQRATLSLNFRSVAGVLDEVERLVGPAFLPEPGVQPPFSPLVANRGDDSQAAPAAVPPRSAIEHWISWHAEGVPPAPARTLARRADELEARAIAADLLDLAAATETAKPESWRWSEVALLFRVTTAQEPYLEALRAAGIPFQVESDRTFYQRREVLDVTSLVRALLDPGDALALVATLRSPWVGVPDAALLPLWSKQVPRLFAEIEGPHSAALAELHRVIEEAAPLVPVVPGIERIADWPLLLHAACDAIAELRLAFRRRPADLFVAELRTRFPFEALAAARWLGRFRLANLERWCDRLVDALIAARGDIDSVLRRLRRAVAEGEEAPAGASGQALDAVRVLTIHKAKGLDFSHVYLPQLHHASANTSAERPPFQGGDEPEYALFGSPTLGLDLVAARRARVAEAERVRLLYVAATRAKSRTVFLGGGAPHGPDSGRGSLLSLIDSRRSARMPADLWQGPATDSYGALWRWLGSESRTVPEAAREKRAPLQLGDSETRRQIFAARRRAAASRSARSWVGGVTSSRGDDVELVDAPAEAPAPSPVALAVGTALHRFLEKLDPRLELRTERARLAAELDALLERELQGPALDEARGLLADTFERMAREGRILSRLRQIADRIVARELPVLVRSDATAPAGPVAALVGALDLLYLDETGEVVIADFKTDRIAGESDLQARVAHHAPQLRAYGEAIALGLGLPAHPRLELWLLTADRIVAVPWQDLESR